MEEKETKIVQEDNEFLQQLQDIDNSNEELTEEEKTRLEEEQRRKNKDAEEARKRREEEAKQQKVLEEEKEKKQGGNEESEEKYSTAQEQVKELKTKYPELDLEELDKDSDFQEYLQGKWVKGGKTITKIYEDFVNFKVRLSSKTKEDVESNYRKKSTPNIQNSGSNGGASGVEDVYTREELDNLSQKMPYMSSKEYEKIEKKYERSINYYKKK